MKEVIPAKPIALSDEDLDKVAGGVHEFNSLQACSEGAEEAGTKDQEKSELISDEELDAVAGGVRVASLVVVFNKMDP